jgi:hypothetical protein
MAKVQKYTVEEVVDVFMAAHLFDKALMKQLGDALAGLHGYDPRDASFLFRSEIRDLAKELIERLEFMEVYKEGPF